MKAVLTDDVFSKSKKSIKYASKGEKVTIIADFINVVIVETEKGIKFPIINKMLKYEHTKTRSRKAN